MRVPTAAARAWWMCACTTRTVAGPAGCWNGVQADSARQLWPDPAASKGMGVELTWRIDPVPGRPLSCATTRCAWPMR